MMVWDGCLCRQLSSVQCFLSIIVALPPSLLRAPNQSLLRAPNQNVRPDKAQPNGATKTKKSRVRNTCMLARFLKSSVGSIPGGF